MLKALLISAFAIAAAGPPAQAAEAVLRVGGDRLVELALGDDAGTVLVANPAIADVVPVDQRRIAVIGKAPGSTSLLVFSKNGERLVNTTVVVGGPDPWTMTVHRGAAGSSLTCAPRCVSAGGQALSSPSAAASAAPVPAAPAAPAAAPPPPTPEGDS